MAMAAALACFAPPASAQVHFTFPDLVVDGLSKPVRQTAFVFPELVFEGLAVPDRATHFAFPELAVTGLPLPDSQRVFTFPELTAHGLAEQAKPAIIAFPALTATGLQLDARPRIIDFPALVAAGLTTDRGVRIFDFPTLTANGLSSAAETPSRLEMIALPLGPVSGKYLNIDAASFDRNRQLNVRYSGLPDKPGAIVLFYTGGDDLRRSAWFYTRASQADGVFERGAGSLPSFTGAWKACIGFGDAPRASKATLNDFEECIDFVLVGGDTLDAAPDIQLPNSPIHAGKPFTLHYEGMPAVNASITLTQQGESRPSANYSTSSRPTGDLKVRLDNPGTYELKLYFTGDAVRARMLLEVQP